MRTTTNQKKVVPRKQKSTQYIFSFPKSDPRYSAKSAVTKFATPLNLIRSRRILYGTRHPTSQRHEAIRLAEGAGRCFAQSARRRGLRAARRKRGRQNNCDPHSPRADRARCWTSHGLVARQHAERAARPQSRRLRARAPNAL